MKLLRLALATGVFGMGVCGSAQTAAAPAGGEMTLAELQAYMDVLHIKQADERGVRVQMEEQKKQIPPWFAPGIVDEMTTEMLKVDFVGLQYPFVKGCLSEASIQAMTAMFASPDGQAYANRVTGAMVDKEAKGTDAAAAHQQVEKEDSGLPTSAIDKLPAAQKELVQNAFHGGAVSCMAQGFQKGAAAVTEARTQAARAVVQKHRAELQAAKEKYDAAHATAKPK